MQRARLPPAFRPSAIKALARPWNGATILGMTTSKPIIFAHDDSTIYYPAGPGRVFSITFARLASADGSDEAYAAATTPTDLSALMIAGDELCPLRLDAKGHHRIPLGWSNIDPETGGVGDHYDDLADAVEMWADYCDRTVSVSDGGE